MTPSPNSNSEAKAKATNDLNSEVPQYDRGIIPAETAARKEREGENFGAKPDSEASGSGDFDTREGQTVDQEGLANNYAIEPEMYINEPGDLREEEEAQQGQRAHDLEELSEDEQGRLTMEQDTRHRGQGMI
jgi:hypothetical protein